MLAIVALLMVVPLFIFAARKRQSKMSSSPKRICALGQEDVKDLQAGVILFLYAANIDSEYQWGVLEHAAKVMQGKHKLYIFNGEFRQDRVAAVARQLKAYDKAPPLRLKNMCLLKKMEAFQKLYLNEVFCGEMLLQLYKVFKDEHEFFANDYLVYYSEALRSLDAGFKLHEMQIPRLHEYFVKNKVHKMEEVLKLA